MAFVKICLILVVGTLFSFILNVDCLDYDKEVESRSSGGRRIRDAPKDDNDGYGSASANYNFQYAVNEGASGNDFGHEEERNGHTTRGQYRVLLPDGRMQIVTYTADENGYRADVTYEGGSGAGGYSSPSPTSPPPQPAADSYGAPSKPAPAVVAPSNSGYGAPTTTSSKPRPSSTFGQRNSGSFVKLRRNILGQNHNYNYSF